MDLVPVALYRLGAYLYACIRRLASIRAQDVCQILDPATCWSTSVASREDPLQLDRPLTAMVDQG